MADKGEKGDEPGLPKCTCTMRLVLPCPALSWRETWTDARALAATVNRLINELLNADLKLSSEVRDMLAECCTGACRPPSGAGEHA